MAASVEHSGVSEAQLSDFPWTPIVQRASSRAATGAVVRLPTRGAMCEPGLVGSTGKRTIRAMLGR
eukprot:6320687-Pyramimonas_sp.AAC.1